MIHPDTELRYISDAVGYGVFAKKFIPEGTIVYVKDSLELEVSPEAYAQHTEEMQKAIEKYSYIDERGYRIVSWDFAKYVNHCCHCNTMSTGYGFEIAIRDIQAGEEITDEYGIFNIEEEIHLVCSKSNCRQVIAAGDFEQYYSVWDEQIQQSLGKLLYVEQPLFSLIDEGNRRELEACFASPARYRSVYYLKYHKHTSHASYKQG